MNPVDPLRIELATPCSANWEEMTGTERKRLCALCNKHVYDLDGLSTAEITGLLDDPDGPECVRFFQREDGTVLTEDCPVGLARRAKRLGKRAWLGVAAALASALGVLGLAGLDERSCEVQGPPPPLGVTGPPVAMPPPPQVVKFPERNVVAERRRMMGRRSATIQVIKGVAEK